jgi:hypothetical protein
MILHHLPGTQGNFNSIISLWLLEHLDLSVYGFYIAILCIHSFSIHVFIQQMYVMCLLKDKSKGARGNKMNSWPHEANILEGRHDNFK